MHQLRDVRQDSAAMCEPRMVRNNLLPRIRTQPFAFLRTSCQFQNPVHQLINRTGRYQQSGFAVFQDLSNLIQTACDYAARHGHVFEELCRRSEERCSVWVWNVRGHANVARSEIARYSFRRNHTSQRHRVRYIRCSNNLADIRRSRAITNKKEVDSRIPFHHRTNRAGQYLRTMPPSKCTDKTNDDPVLQT